MKKITISLLFSAFSLLAFAQTAFNEKVALDLIQRWGNDPTQFLKTETDSDFMFIGPSGHVFDLKRYMAISEGTKAEISVFSDVKTRQYGTTGVATGKWKHSHLLKNGFSTEVFDQLFINIFSNQNGKWMMVYGQLSEAKKVIADEEAAIKNVIESETKDFHENADRNGLLSYWKIDENTRMVYSTPSQEAIYLKGSDLKTAVENGTVPKADNATFEMTNFVIRSGANAAWASFDQKVTYKGGANSFAHEMRGLEKVNGAWKIVSSSVHAYSPNAASDKANDEKQIQAGADAFITSWNNHDFSDMKNYATEDCDWVTPIGSWWKNRKEVIYGHDASHKSVFKTTPMTKVSATTRFISSDVAFVHMITHVPAWMPSPSQKVPESDYFGDMIFVKKGGKWLISAGQITAIDALAQGMDPVKTMPKD